MERLVGGGRKRHLRPSTAGTWSPKRVRALIVLVGFVLFTLTASFLIVGCPGDPAAPLRVKNDTDQALTILVNGRSIGDVKPGAELRNRTAPIFGVFRIQAKTAEGEVVHYRELSFEEMEAIRWRVVIPPLSPK